MALKDDLKKKVPEVYQNSTVMNQFLDAIGEYLDGFKTAIDAVQDHSDYKNIGEDQLELLAKQFGVDFPRNLGTKRKRDHMQDVITQYRAKGSTRALIRGFGLIGWSVSVDETWIVEPSYYTNPPTEFNLTNAAGFVLPLEKYDIIFGADVLYPDGTFVDLFDSAGNQFPKNPIYGEEYGVAVTNPRFVKVPYVRITIDSEDVDLFTEDFVDPDTGQVHPYTESEEFTILGEIRSYFIEQSKPTHVAILEISSIFNLTDTIVYVMNENAFSTQTLSVGRTYDGTFAYGVSIDPYLLSETTGGHRYEKKSPMVGNPNITFADANPDTINRDAGSWVADGFFDGQYVDVRGTVSNDGVFLIGSVTATDITLDGAETLVAEGALNGLTITAYAALNYYGTNTNAPDDVFTRKYVANIVGVQTYIPTRKHTTVDITVPADAVVTMESTNDKRIDIVNKTNTWNPHTVGITNVTNQIIEVMDNTAIRFVITTRSLTTDIDITITHN